MFNEVTRKTLTEDINTSINQGKLLQSSVDFLLTKLSELSKSDNELTSNEIKMLEKQLDYHKQMLVFENDFDIKKLLMRSNLEKSISWLLKQMQWGSIIDTDLLDLECKLEQWLFNNSRDIIDDKLNNKDNTLEWLWDWFLNFKILWDFEKTNNLLNYFTLELLENNILVDEERTRWEDQVIYSKLSVMELNKYITATITLLMSKELVFPDIIELNHWDKTIIIDLLKIKTELITKENVRLQELEVQRLQYEKENDKIYLLWLLESQLNNTISVDWKEVLVKKFSFIWNINNWENKWNVKLITQFINEWLIDKQFIINLYNEWNITKTLLLNYLEENEDFNYVEFIEEYWLTDKVKEITLKYSREKLWISQKVSDKIILENLTLFLLTFIMIESSWYNVKNRAWTSTADWNFQYVNNNWKFKDWEWYSWSFQTALTRVEKLERLKSFLPEWFFKSRFWEFHVPNNPELEKNKKPSDLSSENQTILFFLDIVENWKSIWNVQADDMMKLILSERNSWALWRIYMLLHHTDPDKKTVDVYEREKNKYYYWDKKYIAKNHY